MESQSLLINDGNKLFIFLLFFIWLVHLILFLLQTLYNAYTDVSLIIWPHCCVQFPKVFWFYCFKITCVQVYLIQNVIYLLWILELPYPYYFVVHSCCKYIYVWIICQKFERFEPAQILLVFVNNFIILLSLLTTKLYIQFICNMTFLDL